MKRKKLRRKRYGLGFIGFMVPMIVFLGGFWEILDLSGLPYDSFDILGELALLPVAGCLYVFDARLTQRQMARDLKRAEAAIRRPLRKIVFGNQEPIDFDPHFPTVWPGVGLVSAIDPRRRSTRFITYHFIDADGHALDDGGPIEGVVTDVSQAILPPKRRLFGLLPPKNVKGNIELSVSTITDDHEETTMKFHFRPDDRAIDGWRRTFEQWMHEDRQKTRNAG